MRSIDMERRLDRAYEQGYRNAMLDVREDAFDAKSMEKAYVNSVLQMSKEYKLLNAICKKYKYRLVKCIRSSMFGKITTEIEIDCTRGRGENRVGVSSIKFDDRTDDFVIFLSRSGSVSHRDFRDIYHDIDDAWNCLGELYLINIDKIPVFDPEAAGARKFEI